MKGVELARVIDHTILAANARREAIEKLCDEALKYHFFSVCVNACNVELAVSRLKGSDVAVCAVVGFPLGATLTQIKVAEAQHCVALGAKEIDMVINVAALLDQRLDFVRDEIRAVVDGVSGKALVKVILETCFLDEAAIRRGCVAAREGGARFVKTSTGFGGGGARVEDVKIMREEVAASGMLVKASGGIKNRQQALQMIEAGASRLGTSSGVAIVTEETTPPSAGGY